MHFKRKRTKTRWIAFCGCSLCTAKLHQVPNELKLPQSDRKRCQSATAQLRCDATGFRSDFRDQHKNLTGIIIEQQAYLLAKGLNR